MPYQSPFVRVYNLTLQGYKVYLFFIAPCGLFMIPYLKSKCKNILWSELKPNTINLSAVKKFKELFSWECAFQFSFV